MNQEGSFIRPTLFWEVILAGRFAGNKTANDCAKFLLARLLVMQQQQQTIFLPKRYTLTTQKRWLSQKQPRNSLDTQFSFPESASTTPNLWTAALFCPQVKRTLASKMRPISTMARVVAFVAIVLLSIQQHYQAARMTLPANLMTAMVVQFPHI